MKTFMKTALLACAISVQSCAFANDDKPVQMNQLPATAQQLINKHFAGQKVAVAKVDGFLFGKDYDVIFQNGDKLEFDRQGNLKEADCKNSQVPAALIPEAIQKYVKEHYPQQKIVELNRDRHGYDVKMSNRIELEFNNQFKLTGIDD